MIKNSATKTMNHTVYYFRSLIGGWSVHLIHIENVITELVKCHPSV